MELQQLYYFVTVIEQGTIMKASEILHISQPAITKSIHHLEEETGYELFDREKQRLHINAYGEIVYRKAKSILKEADSIPSVLDAYEKSLRHITIASVSPAASWGISYLYQKLYNQSADKVILTDRNHLKEGLLDYKYQMIITDSPVYEEGVISKELFSEQLYIAVSSDDPLAKKKEISFAELKERIFLMMPGTGIWEDICRTHIPDVLFVFQEEVSGYTSVQKASDFISFRTNLTLPHFTDENRVYVPITDTSACVTYYLSTLDQNEEKMHTLLDSVSSIDWSEYSR